jgi:hypothetical protein
MEEISYSSLEKRIIELEKLVSKLGEHLKFALTYLETDPKSSVVKSRIMLENILKDVYLTEMGSEIKTASIIGDTLKNYEFMSKIDKNIVTHLKTLREWCNLGPHDDAQVYSKNAMVVLDSICEVINWYWKKYNYDNTYSGTLNNINSEIEKFSNLDLKASDHTNYIQKIMMGAEFWEKVINSKYLERITGKENQRENIHLNEEWNESIYSEEDIICGISIALYDSKAFFVCTLQRIVDSLKFKFSILYNGLAYLSQVDFLNNQFTQFGLEGRQYKGYYEGFKYLPYSISDPDIHSKIKNEIENILK